MCYKIHPFQSALECSRTELGIHSFDLPPRIAQCGSLTQQTKNLFCGILARISSLKKKKKLSLIDNILLPYDCTLQVDGYLTTIAVFNPTALVDLH